jgi:hypothetical protein
VNNNSGDERPALHADEADPEDDTGSIENGAVEYEPPDDEEAVAASDEEDDQDVLPYWLYPD